MDRCRASGTRRETFQQLTVSGNEFDSFGPKKNSAQLEFRRKRWDLSKVSPQPCHISFWLRKFFPAQSPPPPERLETLPRFYINIIELKLIVILLSWEYMFWREGAHSLSPSPSRGETVPCRRSSAGRTRTTAGTRSTRSTAP